MTVLDNSLRHAGLDPFFDIVLFGEYQRTGFLDRSIGQLVDWF